MFRRLASSLAAVALFAGFTEPQPPAPPAPRAIRVLLFSIRATRDQSSGIAAPAPPLGARTQNLRQLLLDSKLFDVRLIEEFTGITPEMLAPYDVIALDDDGGRSTGRWGTTTEQAVEQFVRSGKGLVGIHGALYGWGGFDVLGPGKRPTGPNPAWPGFVRMMGAWWSDDEPRTGHGLRHSIQVKFKDPADPLASWFEGGSFSATDEIFHNFVMLPDTEIIATAFDDPKMGGTGKDEPSIWRNRYGKGRVFYCALGHDPASLIEPGFVTMIVRGMEWAATGKATPYQKPAPGAASGGPQPVRVLVVTGGHPYESSFYSLFEGYNDIVWTHAQSNQEAFSKDIRPLYDVVVLYDFTQEIGETQRQHLIDFVESNKGVVVMHWAIADYNSWEWWWRDVVGGRFLLKPDGGSEASVPNKTDQDVLLRPVTGHPITFHQGLVFTFLIGPLHLREESYSGMWVSPDAQVIVTTERPAGMSPAAWASPYKRSRVVYIQPGHYRSTHLHPLYRELVRNSILYAGYRLPPFLPPLGQKREGFVSLMPKKDINEFWIAENNTASSWWVDGNLLHSHGRPVGPLVTKQSFKNFILHVEQRFDPEGWTKAPDDWPESGILTNCPEVPRNSLWPRSLQIQGQFANAGSLGGILGATVKGATNGRVVMNRPPLGTWDRFDIVQLDGRTWIYLNTDLVNVGWDLNPAEGRIGLQSEGWPVDFRNIQIKELK